MRQKDTKWQLHIFVRNNILRFFSPVCVKEIGNFKENGLVFVHMHFICLLVPPASPSVSSLPRQFLDSCFEMLSEVCENFLSYPAEQVRENLFAWKFLQIRYCENWLNQRPLKQVQLLSNSAGINTTQNLEEIRFWKFLAMEKKIWSKYSPLKFPLISLKNLCPPLLNFGNFGNFWENPVL